MTRIGALVYLPLKPDRAKMLNLPLKLPVLAEDLTKVVETDSIDQEIVVKGLRKQFELSGDDYYRSYLVYHLYELFKQRLSEDDFDRCTEILDEAFSILEDYRFTFYRAQLMIKLGEVERAEIDLRVSLSMNPEFYAGHYELGKLFMMKEEYEDAVRSFEKAIEGSGGSFKLPVIGIIDAYISSGSIGSALEIIDRLPNDFPLMTDALLRKGVILNEMQEFAAADRIFTEALAIDERWPLLFNRAFSRTRLGKLQDAMKDLERAYGISSSPDVIYELGLVQKNLGLVEDALKNLQEYYHVTNDPKALVPLSVSAMLLGEFEIALSYARSVEDGDSLGQLIHVYAYLDNSLSWPLPGTDPAFETLINRHERGSLSKLTEDMVGKFEIETPLQNVAGSSDGRIDYDILLEYLINSRISEEARARLTAFSRGRLCEPCALNRESLDDFLRLMIILGSNFKEIDLLSARFPFLVSGEGNASAVCRSLSEIYKWALRGGHEPVLEVIETLIDTLRDFDHGFAYMVSRIANRELELDYLMENAGYDPVHFALAALEAACSGGLQEMADSVSFGRAYIETLIELISLEVPDDERGDF